MYKILELMTNVVLHTKPTGDGGKSAAVGGSADPPPCTLPPDKLGQRDLRGGKE